MKKIEKYNYIGDGQLNSFILKKYKNELSNCDLHFYFRLACFEQEQNGLCKPISASFNQLAEITCSTRSYIGKIIEKLKDNNLIEIVKGEIGSNSKIATTIRRRDITELKNKTYRKLLKDYVSETARRVTEILNQREFIFQGKLVNPNFDPKHTGRIYISKPPIQTLNKDKRINGLLSGLSSDEILIECDFNHAEPTIIKSLMSGIDLNSYSDLYQQLADEEQITRDQAKRKLNTLSYSKSATQIITHWAIPEDSIFHQYAIALDNLKEKIWQEGTPIKGQIRRHTKTLLGTTIECPKGKQIHRGQLLNWKVQGTVADIINNATLEILNKESEKQWTYLIPIHDSIIVKSKMDCSNQIKEIMEDQAIKCGVKINVSEVTHKAVPLLEQV